MGDDAGATRILVLGDARQPHMARWIAAMRAGGAEVEAMSYEPPSLPADVPFHPLPAGGPRFLRHRSALPAVLEVARRLRPRVVTALFVPDYGVLGAAAAHALGARPGGPGPRLAVVALGSDLLLNAHRTPYHYLRARSVLARADVVAVDAAMLGRAAESLGVPKSKLERIDWVPDLRVFAFSTAPGERLTVVSTRQHAPVYDVMTLVRAMRASAARRGDVELVIAGDGPERARLEAAARRLGGRVRFTGRLGAAELADALGSAAVYVSTARSDSTSVSLLEAMACGAVPVVTSIPGNREWVEEGASGLLFRPGDAAELARKVFRALDDTSLRERVRSYNRRRLQGITPFDERVRQVLSRLDS
jgi:L-malate glycosyltransferase